MEKIPFVDLYLQYIAHKDEFDEAISRCIENSSFIGGTDHKKFEAEFSAFCGGGNIALCGNGTDALSLAILELLGQGDGSKEIITVSNTFIATTEAITRVGYRPVFVDIDHETYLINASLIETVITPRTRAIIPVHIYGQMAPMDRIMDIAQSHDLVVIEDAAQAHGAAWMGKSPGQWGHAACFSFYPGKNLGAWGDGGAVFTRDEQLADKIRMRLNHGRKDKYQHVFEGMNSRLDGLQAAILRVKLKYLSQWNDERRQIALWYDELLKDSPCIQKPVNRPEATHVYHLYVIQSNRRNLHLDKLRKNGIGAGIHYPIPLHEQPAYRHLEIPPEALPTTHAISSRILSLPIFPGMQYDQVQRVVEVLTDNKVL